MAALVGFGSDEGLGLEDGGGGHGVGADVGVGPGFDSRHLQIFLTSFLLCAKFCPKQISPARTIKATSTLLLCAKFCSK